MANLEERARDERYRQRRRERLRKKRERERRRRKIMLVLTAVVLVLVIVLLVKLLSSCKVKTGEEADVNATQATEEMTQASPVRFVESAMELAIGKAVKPMIQDGNNQEISDFVLQSQDESIVKVNENNEIVAKKAGDATVICTTADGRTAECHVHVIQMSGKKIRTDLDPEKPMVALTFDDGPNGSNTTSILDSLNKHNGRATFFMAGYKISDQPDIVRMVFEQGHEVANHSRDHLYANDLTESQQEEQMESVNQQIKSITGEEPTLFRCPGGIEGEYYQKSKMPLISWSIDTLDWKTKNTQSTYNAITKVFEKGFNLDGDIVLMHDLQDSTPDAVELICKYLDEKGYQMVTVSELAHYRGVEMQGGQIYNHFYKDEPVSDNSDDDSNNDSETFTQTEQNNDEEENSAENQEED